MTSEVEIGVWVEGVQKWVTGVTRRTTCHDLIKALLRAQQNARIDDTDANHYVIVERWRKVERPLDHEQRILKVWRTWGEAVGEVRFSLRRVREGETGGLSSGGGESVSSRAERSRRRHKWRHAHHSPKETTVHPKKLAREDPRFCETMERLMRLVVAQGETIQTQLRRLQERENQIEQYEQQMHLLRVQNLGTDYLLHSYLKDDQSEVKDEPGSEEKSNDSGVVTEEVVEGITQEEETTTLPGSDEIEEIATLLTRIEQLNTRLLHEEEALAGMLSAIEAADEQQKDEAEVLQQELACVALAHAQLVATVRQNDIRLRESETVSWQQRKQLEILLQEDTESDMETRALQQHLNYIIHLPPSAFRLPEEDEADLKKPTQPPSATDATTKLPTVNASIPTKSTTSGSTNLISILKTSSSKNVIYEEEEEEEEEDDVPPPLPACPPPVLEVEDDDDDDDGDSANTSSLCVSSRSSTSSEASTSSSNTSGVSSKTPDSSAPTKTSSSSSLPASSKGTERSGKDTDSTDSNSDTGLSSLHSSSDEGVYVLDTLV